MAKRRREHPVRLLADALAAVHAAGSDEERREASRRLQAVREQLKLRSADDTRFRAQ